jgi:hypothetical protein
MIFSLRFRNRRPLHREYAAPKTWRSEKEERVMGWNLQQINMSGGITDGPPSAGNPYVSVYNGQQHVGYRDSQGNIWDSFYRPDTGKWSAQKINSGGVTKGPAAVLGPFIGVYHDQQHFVYLDSAGNLWDSWYDGDGWALQKINAGGNTSGPAAQTGGAASWVSIWNDPTDTQQHFTYLGADNAIYDAFWNSNGSSWRLQKIDAGGVTSGPVASGSPFGCVFHAQQHIAYNVGYNDIYDSWYDGDGHWNVQKINDGGVTTGHPAYANTRPFVWVDPNNTQQHFTYRGDDQAIYDAFWDSQGEAWRLQKITQQGGLTNGPEAAGAPAASVFFQQQHIGYRDAEGGLWDSWYDGNGHWSVQKINNGGMTKGGLAAFDPFIWVTGNQQHFTYADKDGTIWDSFYVLEAEVVGFGFGDPGDPGDPDDPGNPDDSDC